MKRKLFLTVLAASLTLVSCGKDKNEEPAGPVDPLTPEQRQSATVTEGLIYDMVESSYGEETATASKSYIAARSEHAALKGVDGAKITSYLADVAEVDFEDPTAILGFVFDVRADGGLDDAIYFGAAVGQTFLKIETDKAEEGPKPYLEVALAEVEKEADNIASNAYAVVDNVLGVVDTLMESLTSEEHPEFMQFLMPIISGQVLDADALKAVLHDVKVMIIDELAKTEANVKYFASEGVSLAAGLLEVVEDVPAELVEFVKELSFDGVIGSIYEGAKAFGEAIDALPEAYYTHLGEITIPAESYAYAVLGAVEALVEDVEGPTDEELDQIPTVVKGALATIYGLVKDYIPLEIQTAVEGILADANFTALLQGVVKCVKDGLKAEMPELSAAQIAHFVGLFSSIDAAGVGSGCETSSVAELEKLPVYPVMQADVVSVSSSETAVSVENEVTFAGEVDEDDGVYSYDITKVHYTLEKNPEAEPAFHAVVEVAQITVTYVSLQEVATVINEFLTKLADKDATDLFVGDVLGVAVPLVNLFSTYVYSLIASELDAETAQTIGMVVFVVGLLASTAVSDGVKTVVHDLFVVVKDLFSAFLPNGETPAAIDFSQVITAAIVAPEALLSLIANQFPASSVAHVAQLGEDIYNLPMLGSTVVGLILGVLEPIVESMGGKIPEDMDAKTFGGLLASIASAILCPAA